MGRSPQPYRRQRQFPTTCETRRRDRRTGRRIADSIGDCVVALTILAAQNGLQIEDCIAQAYDEIKYRRGVMKDGVFVKEEDVQ